MGAGGRPPFFKTEKDLSDKVDEYFSQFDVVDVTNMKRPTITGLALHLGFCSRQSFYDYENSEKYSYVIKRARLAVESIYENNLHFNNPTGSIFALKNMGWLAEAPVVNNHQLTVSEKDKEILSRLLDGDKSKKDK